jgi:hypothetical protein
MEIVMATTQSAAPVFWYGGLQMGGERLGRGPKAEFLAAQCRDANVAFHPVDWQQPANDTVNDWASTICRQWHELFRPDTPAIPNVVNFTEPAVMVASSMAAWAVLAALARLGDSQGITRYCRHLVLVQPVMDATLAFQKPIGDDPSKIVPIPCGKDVPPFHLTLRHIEGSAPYVFQTNPGLWREINPEIGLTILAGTDDRSTAERIAQNWPGPKAPIIPLQGKHYENSGPDLDTLAQTVLDLARSRQN